jgi:2-polyprenyl-3-methyl-5-hydroxy-6-metoxy-1,4-benzoquinol methylase
MTTTYFSNCLLCNSPQLVELKGYEKDYLVKCRKCDFVFSKRIPTEKELQDNYAQYSRNDAISPITIKRFHELLDVFEKYRKTNNIIDVGAGDGHFIAEAKKRGWNAYATEYEDRAVELCRSKGIIAHKGKLSPANYQAGMFDMIMSSEVIEHINNPIEEVQNFHTLLRKGGLAYITTPNFNAISRHYLKGEWNVIEYPEHLSYYTPNTIEKLFTAQGFKKIEINTTGISINRIRNSQGNENTNAAVSDETLRENMETKPLWKVLKKSANTVLDVTKTGDALKAMFVKI